VVFAEKTTVNPLPLRESEDGLDLRKNGMTYGGNQSLFRKWAVLI
jgi:hypothetical protein